MSKKSTAEEFVRRARLAHGDKYDYSKVVYINNATKVCIICPIHGEFWQTPNCHLAGKGCPLCGRENATTKNTMTKQSFVDKAVIVHGNKYNYSKAEYVNTKTKICITCPKHGDFWQTPNGHLQGCGCPQCGNESKRLTTEEFVRRAREIHGDKYNYSKVVFVDYTTKVCIICPKHGEFWQHPISHLNGSGCPKCWKERESEAHSITQEEFIAKAKLVHGDRYDYDETVYVNSNTLVEIKCKTHGLFLQRPDSHLAGRGCPHCNSSKGEVRIAEILDKYNIKYEKQKVFCNDTLFGNKRFYVDFYIPDVNLVIEYNGGQHYFPVEHFGGEAVFEKQKERDISLRHYCEYHKINIIEIPYTEFDNIENIIKEKLNIK